MRSTPAGEGKARPAWRGDPRGAVLLLVTVGLLAASAMLDLGYYAPRGEISDGTPVTSGRDSDLARNRAVVKIVPEMALRPGIRPTLGDAIRFFGLEEEVLRCSALATAGTEEDTEMDERRLQALERQPRAVGDSVTLCLD